MHIAKGTIASNIGNVGYDDPFDFLAGFENQYVFTCFHVCKDKEKTTTKIMRWFLSLL
jgi:hypothetical protein